MQQPEKAPGFKGLFNCIYTVEKYLLETEINVLKVRELHV